MLHPLLRGQIATFKKKNGDLTTDNLDDFLAQISEDYYRLEKKKELQQHYQDDASINPGLLQVTYTIQNIKEVVFAMDTVTNEVIFMSKGCEAMYGYTVNEFHANPNLWYEVVLEEDRNIINGNFPVLAAGHTLVQEYRIRCKDGEIKWIESRLEPTMADGRCVRVDGINIDITNFKKAQLALEENELKFRSLIQNSADVITIADEQLNLTFISQSLERLTGFTLEDYTSRPIYEFFHPDDMDDIKARNAALQEQPGNHIDFLIRFLKRDGSWLWIEGVSANWLHVPAVGGIVTNFRDVTDRIKKEEELKLSNETLKKANNELDKFVYSVSHDLRAPLASVLGAIEYSLHEITDTDTVECLQMMKNSVLKLDVFILDILDYSRNSRTETKRQQVDFKTLLKETKNNLKFITSGNGTVDIRINLESETEMWSDKSRISIVLNNLISNGIRYHNPAVADPYVGVDVMVNASHALITVKDNGIGIDKQYHERIFDMFFRASTISNGSGLGLYIVKEALERLNGTMTFHSEVGRGTEFTIKIPNLVAGNN